jgi:hypothetical protein
MAAFPPSTPAFLFHKKSSVQVGLLQFDAAITLKGIIFEFSSYTITVL